MKKPDFDRLNNHLDMSSDSIREVNANQDTLETLNRWPVLAIAYDALIAARERNGMSILEDAAANTFGPNGFKFSHTR